jgi:beta-lactam-binding protein with PASTA domain
MIKSSFFKMGKDEREKVRVWYNELNKADRTYEQNEFLIIVSIALQQIKYDYEIACLEPSIGKNGLYYKEGEEIEEGTLIKLITSKGVLKMKKFSSLADFRSWASKYGVNINEVFEFNDNIKQGDIIKFSHEEGSIINYNDTVTVYVSDGKAINVPDFYGKSKSSIQGTCNSLGLNCTFYYTRSNNTKDTAVAQNKRAGSQVIKGTYVNIGLSGGANYGVAPSNKCVANKKTTVYIYDELLSNVPATTCANIKNAYPNVKFSCTYATDTGMSPGLLVNSSSIDEKTFDNCTTVTLKISQN